MEINPFENASRLFAILGIGGAVAVVIYFAIHPSKLEPRPVSSHSTPAPVPSLFSAPSHVSGSAPVADSNSTPPPVGEATSVQPASTAGSTGTLSSSTASPTASPTLAAPVPDTFSGVFTGSSGR